MFGGRGAPVTLSGFRLLIRSGEQFNKNNEGSLRERKKTNVVEAPLLFLGIWLSARHG